MDTIRTGRLELVPLTGPFIEAVRGGNLAAAEREIGASVSRWLTIDSTHLVQLNLAQRTADAVGLETAGWAMVLGAPTGSGRVIGSIGFHGPPDDRGRLELGYAVDPAFSREGYAAEAMTALFHWAATRYGITGFLVSVPSSHKPSRPASIEVWFSEAESRSDQIEALGLALEAATCEFPRRTAGRVWRR